MRWTIKPHPVKEKVEKLNAADSLVFQTEKMISEAGENLPEDKKKPIEDALTELKAAHAAADLTAIDAAMEKVQAASQELYAAAQAAQGAQGAPQDGPQPGADAGADDAEVTDVDFEEVK